MFLVTGTGESQTDQKYCFFDASGYRTSGVGT